MRKLILASVSPWRKILLSWLDIPFTVKASDFDESTYKSNNPEKLVKTLALKKAETVAKKIKQGIILGADTVIVTGEKPYEDVDIDIIGKPEDIKHARQILLKLKGRAHQVYTGVALINATINQQKVVAEKTTVTFKDFSNSKLDEYLKTGQSIGKAGAYQILGEAMKLVQNIDGSITNVVGLPLKLTAGLLEEMGTPIKVDIESIVQRKTGYKD